MHLSFDDVLIGTRFSDVRSRKDVDLSQYFCGTLLSLPIISSNMDTITTDVMANAMFDNGAFGALHRFQSIEDNVKMFSKCYHTIVSLGLGKYELERAEALHAAGATTFILDVAHGASIAVVEQVKELRKLLSNYSKIIVGNFADGESIMEFKRRLGSTNDWVDAWKIGIGGGSACSTRIVTGCGLPTLSSLSLCRPYNIEEPLIADGGIRNSGDVAKALAAGASMVMLGGMLAGTDETPGEVIYPEGEQACPMKSYRGSASKESYEVQNKMASWRSPEGESFLVPCKGSVKDVLQQIEGGLRSAFSYTGSSNLEEFHKNADLWKVSLNGHKESFPHGKNNV